MIDPSCPHQVAAALAAWLRCTLEAPALDFAEPPRRLLGGNRTFVYAFRLARAQAPDASGTEKPMDFLFLNASVFASSAPPEDPWLSGFPIAYYYLGYWMFGGLSQLAAVPTYAAFNLSIALVGAMSAGAIFSLGLVSSYSRNRYRTRTDRTPASSTSSSKTGPNRKPVRIECMRA